MKHAVILMALLIQPAMGLVFNNTTNPVVISLQADGPVNLATSRRVDQPTLRYSLEKTDNLTNTWSTVSTYPGDGSSIALQDVAFSVSNAPLNAQFEEIGFSEAKDSAPSTFYRMSYWWVSTPLNEFIDSVDETYVRLRSRDGLKYLYQDPDSAAVLYAAGMDSMDFRSHWHIESSSVSNRYWLRNRMTGQAVYTAAGGGGAAGSTLLLDFGTSGTYRGADVTSPDSNGNYWNGVGSAGVTDAVDISNNVTTMDLVLTSQYGTDYYNGPSGDTQNPAATVYNAAALGDLGIDEAVYDYFAGNPTGGYPVTYELRDLDPTLTYNLTFYGSHKYNTDNTTRYSVTDSGGVTIDSVDLTVGVSANHNQDTTVSLMNVTPDVGNKIYVKFVGTGGNGGYLNAMKVEAVATAGPANANESLLIGNLVPSSSNYQWIVHEEPGYFRIESAADTNRFIAADTSSSGTAVYAELDAASEDQKFIIEALPQGALMPWTSYDEDNYAAIGSGAVVLAPTYDRLLTESEAQKRSAVLLGQEQSFIKWTLEKDANAFVLRYAIEDAPSGGGLNGTVTMILRDGGGTVVQSNTIPVTSEQAWVYFDINMNESNDPADGRPAKRFNEARVKLPSTAMPGYSLELRRVSGEPLIWIDVVETELIDGPITVNVPSDYLDVTSYGAVPDDETIDRNAFINCINAAKSAGKGVYIPEGRFLLNGRIDLSSVVIQGAGMWHTELLYTTVNGGVNTMGFWGQGSNTIIRDLYMTTLSTQRGGGGNAFRQYFGTGSRIENVWAEHFDVGGWIGDYISPYDVSDELVFFNCRIRNTFADGINLARGTRNSIIDNCHFRSTGDDSAASWSSDTTSVPQCMNNRIRYNTMELNWRAAGIGIFGGEAHKVHHNVVKDVVSGAGMRFNTTFANGTQGYEFSANDVMSIYKNSIYRSGTDGGYNAVPTKQGAINLVTTYGDVQNLQFSDILIDDVLNRGVYVDHQYWGTGGVITNITFNGIAMTNMVVGTYVGSNAKGAVEYTDVSVSLDPVRGVAVVQDFSPTFEIINTP